MNFFRQFCQSNVMAAQLRATSKPFSHVKVFFVCLLKKIELFVLIIVKFTNLRNIYNVNMS